MNTVIKKRTETRAQKQAAKFRKLANAMAPTIEAKLNPSVGEQRPTPRRIRMAENIRKEGERLQLAQALLNKLADTLEAGDGIPSWLTGVTSKKAAIELLWHSDHRKEIENLTGCSTAEDPTKKRRREIEQSLISLSVPSFFVTPEFLGRRIVEMADILPHHDVAEPSAGAGHIADLIGERNSLTCCETNYTLRELLTLKGYDLAEHDFLDHTGRYDRIVMNPPFEKLADIDHVRHAFECLRSGGRMVSVMGEGPFFRDDKKAQNFREWLDSVNGVSEQLPARSFDNTITSTGVSTRLIIIDKPTSGGDEV